MAYISDNARFTILDMIPCDVWEEPEQEQEPNPRHEPICSDPERYLCVIDEEAWDYYGSFTACTYTAALYMGSHTGVGAEYLKTCRLAPEETARTILAHYIRQWARMEDDDTAALLLEEADALANG